MKDKNFFSHKTTMFDKEYGDTLNKLYNRLPRKLKLSFKIDDAANQI